MATSVVIPYYGPRRLLDACVTALDQNTANFELVIVDNNAAGEGYGLLAPDILLCYGKNVGFAEACNQGAKAASCDNVLFLNCDTEVREGWLEPLVAVLQDDTVAAVGSHLVYPDGRTQHAGIRFAWDAGALVAYNILENGCGRDVEAVTGASMMVDRGKFLAIGGFDTGFWCGYEDVDLCIRLRECGWRVVYEPASNVMHHESATGPERWTRVRENVQRLQIKHQFYKPGV